MQLKVSPRIEAGTDRGGENLYIDFELETNENPDLDRINEVLLDPECSGASVEIDGLDPFNINHKIRHDLVPHMKRGWYAGPGAYHVWTDYEFTWKGTGKDALQLLKDAVANGAKWEHAGKVGGPPIIRLSVFIDGNAD